MKDEIRCSIEVREDQDRMSPGRIVGEALVEETRARTRSEVFERGAIRWPEGGIVLNRQHDRKSPIMRVQPKRDGDRIVVDQPLPNTQAGRDAAEEIRTGLFTGMSIEFRAVKQSFSGGVRRISEALLGGVALVHNPDYATSVEVRAQQERDDFYKRALSWL